ncbi:MAG TPA: site-2 protease family protein [Kofleriaceae bacterium]|nr:site-2 protease family protein [Kofleriaceae bacterium]
MADDDLAVERDPDAPAGAAVGRRPGALTAKDLALHLGLFGATCVTTYLSGGLAFAATLMAILGCHEMGHYVVARRHGIQVSPPYFIPMPPYFTLGTLGAVIKMRAPIRDRNQLLDVGAAGPLAGLVVAIPCLVIGLHLSSIGSSTPGANQEGNSLLYGLLKLAMFGRWLPSGDVDVQLHPMAWAAWVGLLITMINLIPIGQLDGGHVMRAVLGDRHERLSELLHRALLAVGLAAAVFLYFVGRAHGAGALASIGFAILGVAPWLVWSIAIAVMRNLAGGEYHPAVFGPPLTRGRRRLAALLLVVFVLIFAPVPLRPVL